MLSGEEKLLNLKIKEIESLISKGLNGKKINGLNENVLFELIQISGYFKLALKKSSPDNKSIFEDKRLNKMKERLEIILASQVKNKI